MNAADAGQPVGRGDCATVWLARFRLASAGKAATGPASPGITAVAGLAA
jgi:hypothetical protein